jgi:hypothetical protein
MATFSSRLEERRESRWCNVDPETNTQVFILRFWLERREVEGAEQFWRGMIEHVPTGERRYFNRIAEIPKIIKLFLKASDVNLDQRKSIWRWLKQWFSWKNNKTKYHR